MVGNLRQQAAMPDRHRGTGSTTCYISALLWACCLTLRTSQAAAVATAAAAAAVLHVPKGASAGERLAKQASLPTVNVTDGESWPPAERMRSWIVENGGEVRPTWHLMLVAAQPHALHATCRAV